ncbi:MAG: glycosyltransferase [Candidatus Diapherotrites archaeon]
MALKKVSIIVPVLNEEKTLEKCLKSVKGNSYKDKELVVIDNGSTDGSQKIAMKYADKFFIEKRKGIVFAKNLGIKKASGDFIAFTDADCVASKDWLKELISCFKDNSIASVGGPNLTPKDDSKFSQHIGKTIELLSSLGAEYGSREKKIKEVEHNPGCNVIYRKEILKELKGFNEKMISNEDPELDFRIREKGFKLIFNPEAIVWHYRKGSYKRFFRQAFSFSLGKTQLIKLHPKSARYYHFLPSLNLILLFLLLLFSINLFFYAAAAEFMALIIAGLYSYFKFKLNPLIISSLIFVWVFGWALGFIRGALK